MACYPLPFMFSFLARLRTIIFLSLLFLSFSHSREESLFTSSVTYCEPPETLLIQQFDVAYIAKNQSVWFNISAASVKADVNVTANLLLNVYGLNPINVTLDLCDILGGALCPLPMYNFTGSDSISLPDSLGVADRIPGIAFKIPDLEGFAQLTLAEVGTGVIKACVQATLSNGWSTHQPSVEWVTGAIALAALLSAAWQSLSPEALAPFRLLDLLYLYQTIACTSFLSLNYPSVYRAFTLNFAWAMGLFSSPSSSLQDSINRMRHLTGGKLADATSGSAVGLVNRKLSPYNVPDSRITVLQSLPLRTATFDFAAFGDLSYADLPFSASSFKNLLQQSATQGEVQTVTAASSNVLQAGIPIYVNSIHIASANAFMTVFVCALVLVAIALAVFMLGYGVLYVVKHFRIKYSTGTIMSVSTYRSFVRAWCTRLSLIAFSPIIIFVFYQWTLNDSWLSILLSVVSFLAIITLISLPAIFTVRLAHRSAPHGLYSDTKHIASNGPLYAQYRTSRYFFFLPLLIASFLKAIFIAFAKGNGEVQVILVIIVEGAVVISLIILRPHKTKGSDVFSIFLAVVRLVCGGLMVAFVEGLKVAAIPRVVIGLVIAVIFSVAVLITFINLIVHSGIERLWKGDEPTRHRSANDSILEKGDMKGDLGDSTTSEHSGRPTNPTPEHNIPLDPHILQSYPVSPTATATEQPSIYSRDSGTITLGSLLPRRWSFSQPNSPTNSSQIHEPSSHSSNHTNVLT